MHVGLIIVVDAAAELAVNIDAPSIDDNYTVRTRDRNLRPENPPTTV